MSAASNYILDSAIECERLDRQGLLQGSETILRHFDCLDGKRILDAGSGSGWTSRLLAQRFPNAEVVGIDVHPGYVDYARRKAQELGLSNVHYFVGDLQDMELTSGSFDVVWSQFVLYFIPDASAAMKEFRRVAKVGGKVSVALHGDPLQQNHPEDPSLQPLIERLVAESIPGYQAKALPELFSKTGLVDINLDIRTDPIYTTIGKAKPEQTRNIREVLAGPISKLTHIFGSKEKGSAFLEDLIAYFEREDTSAITTYWVTTGTVPASPTVP